jgi:trehalose/maltose hydrolase-like predicted phosphorylase
VFWDSDIFVLPFFAATRPAAARAMLEYRVQRLGAAQEAAREAGFGGAWFPWESAASGRDVTPTMVTLPDGKPLRIWTGERELHIVADVAWAAVTYGEWTGDRRFMAGPGRRLLVETARFWASRAELEGDGRYHLRGVIGPDEYHEFVDDNVYTNVMARWNLRAAAASVREAPVRIGLPDEEEVGTWLDVADRIVDGYDPDSGLYEQFEGFFALEDVQIALLTRRPVWGDMFLGRARAERAQVVKQTDVLMLHHLVPDEVGPGSLIPNLDYYEPRTAHGSSLSPGTHAALLARAGRSEQALDALDMTAYLDLDDRTRTGSDGLHIPTMGGLWQALVMGFGGIRPQRDALSVDPRLPPGWDRLHVPVRFRGVDVRIAVDHETLAIRATRPIRVQVPGPGAVTVGTGGVRLERTDEGWRIR